jgi:hypothetical protein
MWRYLILAEIDAHYLRQRGVRLPLDQVLKYYIVNAFLRVDKRVGIRKKLLAAASRVLPRSWSERLGAKVIPAEVKPYDFVADSGYFNIRRGVKFAPLLLNPVTRRFFYPLLALAIALGHVASPVQAVRLIVDHVIWSLVRGRPPEDLPTKSLRQVVLPVSNRHEGATDSMLALRAGR